MPKIISNGFVVFLFLVLAACGGNNNESGIGQGNVSSPQSCDVNSQKQFVFDVMHDTYLWYDEVPEVNISNFETIDDTLNALRAPLDRFSYITTVEANDNFFEEGTFEGFGFRAIVNESNNEYLIGFVFNDSPSGRANWQRTDRIIAINGVSSAEVIAGDGLSASLAGLVVGDTATFTVATLNGTPTEQMLTKTLVTMNTVLVTETVETDNQTIGYIALSSFIEKTSDEFSTAIDTLLAANINELVLDLRYNGGGRVTASKNVASHIGGNLTSGFNYSKTIHNDKYTSSNNTNPFQQFSNALGLSRVYVLTTASTCSASELVMNGLAPFVEIIQIGGTTCGKPVGMYGKEFCEQLILPIEFQSVNHLNEGNYFDGLVADCTVSDDLIHHFADPQEAMFSEAIYYMDNSSCQPNSLTNKTRIKKMAKQPSDWLPQRAVN